MQVTQDPRSVLLTLDQVAERLALAPATLLRYYVSERRLPFMKLGGRWRIAESDLIAWIEERKEGGES